MYSSLLNQQLVTDLQPIYLSREGTYSAYSPILPDWRVLWIFWKALCTAHRFIMICFTPSSCGSGPGSCIDSTLIPLLVVVHALPVPRELRKLRFQVWRRQGPLVQDWTSVFLNGFCSRTKSQSGPSAKWAFVLSSESFIVYAQIGYIKNFYHWYLYNILLLLWFPSPDKMRSDRPRLSLKWRGAIKTLWFTNKNDQSCKFIFLFFQPFSPRASTAWSGCSWKLQSCALMWRNWRRCAAKLRGAQGRSHEQVKKHLFDGQSMVNQMLLRGCHVSWLIYTWPALVRQFPWKPRGTVPFAKLADEGCKFEKSFWNCNFQYLAIPCNISDEFRCTACPSTCAAESCLSWKKTGETWETTWTQSWSKKSGSNVFLAFQPLHE